MIHKAKFLTGVHVIELFVYSVLYALSVQNYEAVRHYTLLNIENQLFCKYISRFVFQ